MCYRSRVMPELENNRDFSTENEVFFEGADKFAMAEQLDEIFPPENGKSLYADEYRDDATFFGAMFDGVAPPVAEVLTCLFSPLEEHRLALNSDFIWCSSKDIAKKALFGGKEEDTEENPKEYIVNGINVLADYDLAPLRDNCYYTHSYVDDENGNSEKIILIKNAADDKKYFLYESDGYKVLRPFDNTVLFEGWKYKNWDQEVYYNLRGAREFIYKGKDLLAGLPLAPWHTDADRDTGEVKVKSWFKYDGERLHYKTTRGQKYFLLRSEDFEIPHWYKLFWPMDYGTKIFDGGGLRYELHDPKKTFFLNNIMAHNEDFLDIISYEKEYNKDYAKYALLKKTIFKLLKSIISSSCECDKERIYLPHKMISCVFRRNSDKITDLVIEHLRIPEGKRAKAGKKSAGRKKVASVPIDPRIMDALWEHVKTGGNACDFKPPRLSSLPAAEVRREEPAPVAAPMETYIGTPAELSHVKEVIDAITTFTKMINFGQKPDTRFYDCAICTSESVCMYKEEMAKHREQLDAKHKAELYEQYLQKSKGQIPLYPEMIYGR